MMHGQKTIKLLILCRRNISDPCLLPAFKQSTWRKAICISSIHKHWTIQTCLTFLAMKLPKRNRKLSCFNRLRVTFQLPHSLQRHAVSLWLTKISQTLLYRPLFWTALSQINLTVNWYVYFVELWWYWIKYFTSVLYHSCLEDQIIVELCYELVNRLRFHILNIEYI
jgi:hypothetical protein